MDHCRRGEGKKIFIAFVFFSFSLGSNQIPRRTPFGFDISLLKQNYVYGKDIWIRKNPISKEKLELKYAIY